MSRDTKTGTIFAGVIPAVGLFLLATAGPVIAGPALVVGMFIAVKSVSNFLPTLIRGLGVGVIVGWTVLGPGLRAAMRAVSIMDPGRVPEFTLEGTLFIVIIVGGVFGLTLGVVVAFGRRVMAQSAVDLMVSAMMIGFLLSSPDLRMELIELGGGGWFNIPLFAAVGAGFSTIVYRLIGRFDKVSSPTLVDPANVRI